MVHNKWLKVLFGCSDIYLAVVGTYPINNRKLYFKSIFNIPTLFCLGYVNLPIISHITKAIALYSSLKRNLPFDTKCIIVYGMTSYFLTALYFIKNEKIKICLVVPDLPQYMSDSRNVLYLLAKKVDKRLMNWLLKCVDGYVLISKYMANLLPVANNNWTVVEGIFDPKYTFNKVIQYDNVSYEYIMYSGTLAKRYGVMNLVKAFQCLEDTDVFLVICGLGDSEQEVLKYAKRNPRIIFKGQIRREEVLKLQKNACLLVNPRLPNGAYTKYSFPSKNMEYFASGTPTLLYRLKGIPDEYFEYCFTLTDQSIEALTLKIKEILTMNKDDLRQKGMRARQFIIDKKNPQKQVERIIELIRII